MTAEYSLREGPVDVPALKPTVFGSPAFCAELSAALRQRGTTTLEYAMPSGVAPTLRCPSTLRAATSMIATRPSLLSDNNA